MAKRTFLKDDPEVQKAKIAPEKKIKTDHLTGLLRDAGELYNRVGGLVHLLESKLKIEPGILLAIWLHESGSKAPIPNRAIIRFENHLLYDQWGKSHKTEFQKHFKFNETEKKRHFGHYVLVETKKGKKTEKNWKLLHPRGLKVTESAFQDLQYYALQLATQLSSKETALSSISIGGTQIVIGKDQYKTLLGYQTPEAMYNAFQQDEKSQLIGTCDFILSKRLSRYLQSPINWIAFGKAYNGDKGYGKRLQQKFRIVRKLQFHQIVQKSVRPPIFFPENIVEQIEINLE